MPHFSNIVAPIQSIINVYTSTKKFSLTDEARTAVAELKKALINAVTLAHRSRTSNTYQLITDASGTAVGATLHQLIDGEYQPVGFYLKRLSST